jgi:hypothetical protein
MEAGSETVTLGSDDDGINLGLVGQRDHGKGMPAIATNTVIREHYQEGTRATGSCNDLYSRIQSSTAHLSTYLPPI